jgi:hypothetical protein
VSGGFGGDSPVDCPSELFGLFLWRKLVKNPHSGPTQKDRYIRGQEHLYCQLRVYDMLLRKLVISRK